jgi:hypothetical protein
MCFHRSTTLDDGVGCEHGYSKFGGNGMDLVCSCDPCKVIPFSHESLMIVGIIA